MIMHVISSKTFGRYQKRSKKPQSLRGLYCDHAHCLAKHFSMIIKAKQGTPWYERVMLWSHSNKQNKTNTNLLYRLHKRLVFVSHCMPMKQDGLLVCSRGLQKSLDSSPFALTRDKGIQVFMFNLFVAFIVFKNFFGAVCQYVGALAFKLGRVISPNKWVILHLYVRCDDPFTGTQCIHSRASVDSTNSYVQLSNQGLHIS